MFSGLGISRNLPSQARSAREDAAEKPAKGGSSAARGIRKNKANKQDAKRCEIFISPPPWRAVSGQLQDAGRTAVKTPKISGSQPSAPLYKQNPQHHTLGSESSTALSKRSRSSGEFS